MEPCSNDGRKEIIETKHLCGKGGDSGNQTQDSGTAGHPMEPLEVSSVLAEQQLPGKHKKMPFKFFGVRKSICTLPNFFSGRSKGPAKGTFKKSLCKSKTHDCISDVTDAKAKRGPLENISNGGMVLNQNEHRGAKTLPSSQSAHLAIEASSTLDFNHPGALSWGSTEVLDIRHKEDKSLSFPKAKKGLKGLFSSMRRHKKSKTQNSEKGEPHELTVMPLSTDPHERTVMTLSTEQVNNKLSTEPIVDQDNVLSRMDKGKTAVCKESPSKKPATNKVRKRSEIDIADKLSESTVVGEMCSKTDSIAINVKDNNCCDVKLDAVIVCTTSDNGSIPQLVNSDDLDNEPASTHSTDLISLIFDEVSSLKSFDSLTGCGDIIADQDIDSIAESTISVERSRDLSKRSSCLVTYQGGGEEMATPDELGDEYLQQLWERAAEGDASCDENVLMSEGSPGELQEVSDSSPPALQMEITQLCAEGAVVESSDILTPQSDQQGSAPNSDEGYYDSTTPGPDDDTGDSLSHDFKKDRLPRDSYSGDALYEFYEADDSLMSPPTRGKALFENEKYCPELFDHFLDNSLPVDSHLMQIIEQQVGAMETEEDRLAAIQKQILQWERKRESIFKKTDLANRKKITKEKQNVECKNRNAILIGRDQSCLDTEQVVCQTSSRAVDAFTDTGTEHPNWSDFDGMSLPRLNKLYSNICDQRPMGNCHVQVTKNGSDLDGVVFGAKGNSGSETYSSIRKAHHGSCLSREPSEVVVDTNSDDMMENCEQAVSFSQALVDFTSNGTLFSSLSESLGSSDSGSSFTQNLATLPTMVNFDIVDVENEGEGEFEQQIEMNAEEEINASFEDFESSYVQKESFAECDERMFHMDPQSAFQSCNWGVASLPRHLSLYRLGSSMPAPLAPNRRSRSLDTESLEFELANLHLSKSGLRSCELPVKWEDKQDRLYVLSNCNERALPFYADGRETANWLRSQHYNADLSPEVEKEWDLDQNVRAAVFGSDLHRSVPCKPDLQRQDRKVVARRPENRGASNPSTRQMVRPSNLPLQSKGKQSPEVSSAYQYYAQHMKKKLAIPLEERKDFTSKFSFSPSSENQTKFRPVGITQGMPQFNPNCTKTLTHSENYGERYESPYKVKQKSRVQPVQTMPASWAENYS